MASSRRAKCRNMHLGSVSTVGVAIATVNGEHGEKPSPKAASAGKAG
jgi:hypothetical protein